MIAEVGNGNYELVGLNPEWRKIRECPHYKKLIPREMRACVECSVTLRVRGFSGIRIWFEEDEYVAVLRSQEQVAEPGLPLAEAQNASPSPTPSASQSAPTGQEDPVDDSSSTESDDEPAMEPFLTQI